MVTAEDRAKAEKLANRIFTAEVNSAAAKHLLREALVELPADSQLATKIRRFLAGMTRNKK